MKIKNDNSLQSWSLDCHILYRRFHYNISKEH